MGTCSVPSASMGVFFLFAASSFSYKSWCIENHCWDAGVGLVESLPDSAVFVNPYAGEGGKPGFSLVIFIDIFPESF